MRTFPCGSCKQVGELLKSCPYCGGTGTITDPGCESLVPNFTSMVRCGADTCNVTRTRCHEHMPPRPAWPVETYPCEQCERETEYLNDDALCQDCAFDSAIAAAERLYDLLCEDGE